MQLTGDQHTVGDLRARLAGGQLQLVADQQHRCCLGQRVAVGFAGLQRAAGVGLQSGELGLGGRSVARREAGNLADFGVFEASHLLKLGRAGSQTHLAKRRLLPFRERLLPRRVGLEPLHTPHGCERRLREQLPCGYARPPRRHEVHDQRVVRRLAHPGQVDTVVVVAEDRAHADTARVQSSRSAAIAPLIRRRAPTSPTCPTACASCARHAGSRYGSRSSSPES